jgi:hypothetical protein
VAASAHAGCARFRLTDPFLTGKTRRALAKHLGAPDTTAGIPEARWMRAVTFESLVRSDRFVSELLTKTVGQLDLPKPTAVRRRDCQDSVETTAAELAAAHVEATERDTATMLTGLAVPYPRLEDVAEATAVKPDFAVVCARLEDGRVVGSWLVMGDAKDYERVRSRIGDYRLLKGFLQVALGAESAAAWSKLPDGMKVHRSGALAVPRNAFLQPEAVVEQLDDHRREVRARAGERLDTKEKLGKNKPTEEELADYVAHIEATFDPTSCVSCSLFSHCREELRSSVDPAALLVEIGVPRLTRPAVASLVEGSGVNGAAPSSVVGQVKATVAGLATPTGRLRLDPCGLPGTIEVVLAKSDAAALGVHGIALRPQGGKWESYVFDDPQSAETRRAVMEALGAAIQALVDKQQTPIHMVVPDRPTADLLATMADSLAGVELSRLRWQHDLDEGRPALTFDGEQATLPDALSGHQRLAVSFSLEEDRARAMKLRTPIVIARDVLATHFVVGGPSADAGRLDYLVEWARAKAPLDHRVVSDDITERKHTPGARLSNTMSDEIHKELRSGGKRYGKLVEQALKYRIDTLANAIKILEKIGASKLRVVHSALEQDAQEVWGRRVALHASDLVRFSRTFPAWRNDHVDMLDADKRCHDQLAVVADRTTALELAEDAANRELAVATVVGVDPYLLDVKSRRLGDGALVMALHVNNEAAVERDGVSVNLQKGSFKLGGMPIGVLEKAKGSSALEWHPRVDPELAVGDELLLADALWFRKEPLKSGHEVTIDRPKLDGRSAPLPTCEPSSYESNPSAHRWCCRPHEVAEAEWSDILAGRRARKELNPERWPPLVDEERFDVGDLVPDVDVPDSAPAEGLSLDDVD